MYTLLKIISWKFQILPRKLALFIGRMLGSFFYYFIPLRKSIAMKNLEIAFPDWNSNKKKLLIHSCYRHYGMVLADFFRLPKVKREKDKKIVNIPFESIELLKLSIWISPFLVKTELYVVSLISVCVKNFPTLNLEHSLSIELQELNRSRVVAVEKMYIFSIRRDLFFKFFIGSII